MLKLLVLCTVLVFCESLFLYSSFYAPLFDRRILHYRVDVPFDPDAAVSARNTYEKNYGYRGEKLIADLGNGKGPSKSNEADVNKIYGNVKLHYTLTDV